VKRFLAALIALWMLIVGTAFAEVLVDGRAAMTEEWFVEYGYDYSTPDEVALYLHVFRELPPNFLTKDEARDFGWVSSKGNLWEVTGGMSIGGDVFGNREGLLPEEEDRIWYECDVNYYGGYRGDERLVFANDGLIYYTEDHYESFDMLYDGWYEGEIDFELIYGEEEEGWFESSPAVDWFLDSFFN